MYTSYEERLPLIQQFHEGSNAFLAKIPQAVLKYGEGWDLTSIAT